MTERSKRLRRRAAPLGAILLAAAVALLCLFAPPASAEDITLGTNAEAWHLILPTCTAAAVCVPAGTGVPPVSPFTAGTLHVARVAGVELARTYIKLDLGGLPSGATITGGTLTLPIATDPTSGTLNAERAQIQACFMVASFTPAALGSVEEPPLPDCLTSSTARLVALADGSSFVVNLAPFAERWTGGEPNEGIALVPAPEGAPSGPAPLPSQEVWHVAFNGAASEAAAKISATVTYAPPRVEAPPADSIPPITVPGVPGYFIPAPQQPVVQRPPAVPPQAPTVMVATRGFEYAGVFVLPLIALAVGSAVSYSLTREIEA